MTATVIPDERSEIRDPGVEFPISLEPVANFSWVPLPDTDEAEVTRRLGEAGVVVRAGEGLGGPGHIRVTYGTRAENEDAQDFYNSGRRVVHGWCVYVCCQRG